MSDPREPVASPATTEPANKLAMDALPIAAALNGRADELEAWLVAFEPEMGLPFLEVQRRRAAIRRGEVIGHDEAMRRVDAALSSVPVLPEAPKDGMNTVLGIAFEFTDPRSGKDWRIQGFGGEPWLHYKHPDGGWVTLAPVRVVTDELSARRPIVRVSTPAPDATIAMGHITGCTLDADHDGPCEQACLVCGRPAEGPRLNHRTPQECITALRAALRLRSSLPASAPQGDTPQ